MTFYPQSASGLDYESFPAGPAAAGVTVTSDAAANTKGAYTEIAAATSFDANWITVEITQTTQTTVRRYLIDIAIGAAASEVVVIPNLMAEGGAGGSPTDGSYTFTLPLDVPSGSRISARCQDSVGSGPVSISVTLAAAGDTPGPTAYTAHGVDTATSLGTSVNAGGSINTKGAYAQLSASLGAVAQYAMLMMSTNGNTQTAAATFAVDLATGAAASEVVLVPDLRGATSNNSDYLYSTKTFAFPTYIAAATRVAVRMSSTTADATDRVLTAALYTAVAPTEASGGASSSVSWG